MKYGRLIPKDMADAYLHRLTNELEWVRRDTTPRQEYYTDLHDRPYTYGKGAGVRTYPSQPFHEAIGSIQLHVIAKLGMLGYPAAWTFEAVFLNRYINASENLGWHADDSDALDDARPIVIVSLGAEREIMFRPMGSSDPEYITRTRLEHGSICMMLPGMQETWQHRIPKSDRQCGERISLTFRGVHPPAEEPKP